MKIFCDTNIITEFLEKRDQYQAVAQILNNASADDELYISEGGFYTMTYLVDHQLRRMEIHNPERLEKERKILLRILSTFHVASAMKGGLWQGVQDNRFKDLEDSYQYQVAIECGADVLLTINIKDFKDVSSGSLKIMTPQEYIVSL